MNISVRPNIFGVRFDLVNVNEMLDFVYSRAATEQKTVICHVNAHGLNIAHQEQWYHALLNRADLVFCDGFGALLGARMLGYKVRAEHRMTCPDYFEELARGCAQRGLSLYLLAGQPGVGERTVERLAAVVPSLRVASHHGYFAKTGEENDRVIDAVNAFRPDVLYIGFGMPLQERWLRDNLSRTNARVFLPLGACLDFYSGLTQRGPTWATFSGLEWLSRLLTEPRRLWRRYVFGNPLFLMRVMLQRLGLLRLRVE